MDTYKLGSGTVALLFVLLQLGFEIRMFLLDYSNLSFKLSNFGVKSTFPVSVHRLASEDIGRPQFGHLTGGLTILSTTSDFGLCGPGDP